MTIKENIQKDITEAMKQGNKETVTVLRTLFAAIRKQEIDQQKDLSDNETIELLSKKVKTHQESIEAFKKGNRDDLVIKEEEELNHLYKYLPKQLSPEEVQQIVKDALQTTQATSVKDMGKVMEVVRPQLTGKADMKVVADLIKQHLQV